MTVISRLAGRLLRLPRPITTTVRVERGLAVTMPDGPALRTDRWSPEGQRQERGEARPTVLIRTPYGRKSQELIARLLAERGFHVVVQSCRGTFGSEGVWEPFRHEAVDGRATIAWMLGQPWCNGPILTLGGSYVGLTQWAVATDPPPELRAMALSVTAANFRDSFVYPGGAFGLESALTWLHQLEHQERGTLRALWNMARAQNALKRAFAALPLADTDRLAVGRTVAFYRDWLAHDGADDPWWDVVDFSRDYSRGPARHHADRLVRHVSARAARRLRRTAGLGPRRQTHDRPMDAHESRDRGRAPTRRARLVWRSAVRHEHSPLTCPPVRDGRQTLARAAGLATSGGRSKVAPLR